MNLHQRIHFLGRDFYAKIGVPNEELAEESDSIVDQLARVQESASIPFQNRRFARID